MPTDPAAPMTARERADKMRDAAGVGAIKHARLELVNERGRAIRIEVATGLRFPDGCTTRITLTSPDTVDEGFVTDAEAKALRNALNEALPTEHTAAVTAALEAAERRVAEIREENEALKEDLASYMEIANAEANDCAVAQQCAREAEQRVSEETAIVNRIWSMFGNPSFDSLKGRSIYDLIAELQAAERRVGEAVTRVEELERLLKRCVSWMNEAEAALDSANLQPNPDWKLLEAINAALSPAPRAVADTERRDGHGG